MTNFLGNIGRPELLDCSSGLGDVGITSLVSNIK